MKLTSNGEGNLVVQKDEEVASYKTVVEIMLCISVINQHQRLNMEAIIIKVMRYRVIRGI